MAGLNNSTPHENNFFNLDFQFALFFVCFVLVLSPFQSLLFMILAYIILSINCSKTGFPCHLIGHHETSNQIKKYSGCQKFGFHQEIQIPMVQLKLPITTNTTNQQFIQPHPRKPFLFLT